MIETVLLAATAISLAITVILLMITNLQIERITEKIPQYIWRYEREDSEKRVEGLKEDIKEHMSNIASYKFDLEEANRLLAEREAEIRTLRELQVYDQNTM